MTDRLVLQGDAMTRALRQWLRERPEIPPIIATTLAYELAALLARYATSLADVDVAIDRAAATMKEQVRSFGIGVEHP